MRVERGKYKEFAGSCRAPTAAGRPSGSRCTVTRPEFYMQRRCSSAVAHEIAIVGGGVAGTVLANRLADELRTEIQDGRATVTLYTDDPTHVYKPLFLYVAFGRKRVEEAYRDERDLLDGDIDLVVASVTEIDVDAKTLKLDGAKPTDTGESKPEQETVEYDTLAIGTGADLAPEAVPGLEHAHHFYGRAGAEALREALAGFEGGDVVLTVAGMPHMCPVAPVEVAFIAEEWLAERGVEADVTYTYPIDA
ncbi:MAG: FAD-dependent oxidoreductase, partial [Halobacteriota archaeon]